MWAVKHPEEGLMVETLADTRDDAYFALFDYMPEDFRARYWKQPTKSKLAYQKLGYKAVQVELVEVKK